MKEFLATILLTVAGWFGVQQLGDSGVYDIVSYSVPNDQVTFSTDVGSWKFGSGDSTNATPTVQIYGGLVTDQSTTTNATTTGSSNVNGSRCFDGTSCISAWSDISAGSAPYVLNQWLDTTNTPTFVGLNASTTRTDTLTVYNSLTVPASSIPWTSLTGIPTSTTDQLPEGAINTYYTDARARAAISNSSPITYSSVTGVIGFDFTTANTWSGLNIFSDIRATQLNASNTANFQNVNIYGDLDVLGDTTVVDVTVINVQNNGNATTTGQHYYGSFLELATINTPSDNPQTGEARLYATTTDDGLTTQIHVLDSFGVDIDLTGGGGGCTTLDCLSDTIITAAALNDVLQFNGSNWVDSPLNLNQLSGNVTVAQGGTNITSYTLGDILYSSATNVLSKLGIGTGFLRNVGGVPAWSTDVMDLTTDQTASNVKRFNQYPRGPGTTPTTSDQLIDKAYADSIASGFLYKQQVVVASTGDVATSGAQTVDGVSVVAGNRVILKDEPTPANNGCYLVVDPGNWTLCTDSDTDAEVNQGTAYFVESGTVNTNKGFAVATADPITPGVTSISFAQISGATAYSAGDGLDLTGSTFSTDLRADRGLQITSTELDTKLSGSITVDSKGLKVATTTPFNWTALNTWTDARPTMLNASTTNVGTLRVYGATIFNTISYTWPSADGTSGQFLSTNGAGTLSWATGGSGGGGGTANSTSTLQVVFLGSNATARTWTNMPLAETEFFGATNNRVWQFGSALKAYRISAIRSGGTLTAGSGADLNLECSLNSGSSWNNADLVAGAGEVAISNTAGALSVGSFAELSSTCKADALWRIVGKKDSAATDDPQFTRVIVEFKELLEPSVPSSQAWQKYTGLSSPASIITPTTTNASIFVSGNGTTTASFHAPEVCIANTCRTSWPSGVNDWNFPTGFSSTVLSPTTSVGIFINASSTINANLKVSGNGTGSIKMGDASYTNYGGISLNGSLAAGNYNFLSGPSDTDLYINRPTGKAIHFRENNGGDQVIIQGSTGKVGIGVTNPTSTLSVAGSVDFRGNATTTGWFNIGTTAVGTTLGSLIGAGDLFVGSDATITNNLTVNGDATADYYFSTNNDYGVRVGSISSQRAHYIGSADWSESSYSGYNMYYSGANSVSLVANWRYGVNSSYAGHWQFKGDTGLLTYRVTPEAGASGAGTAPASWTEAFVINASGSVGIGTLTPTDKRLSVVTTSAGITAYGIYSTTTAANLAYGVYSTADTSLAGGFTGAYGVYGEGRGNSASKFGVYGLAEGSNTNYGLYGNASGGTTNWGLYVNAGNAYFAGSVGIGDTSPLSLLTVGNGDKFRVDSLGNVTTSASIISTSATNIGWNTVSQSDTACNTTCTNGCVVGFNITLGSQPDACNETTSDECLCAGAN